MTTEEEEYLEMRNVFAKLRLIDDVFMTIFFQGFPVGVQEVLRIIMQKDDLKVMSTDTQKKLSNFSGHELILDVFARDSSGRTYDIEIQRDDRGASPYRARYHSSLMDSVMLQKHKKFDTLMESYVIFITENDVIGEGLPIYNIERYITQTGEKFGDGSNIIYVNGAYKNTDTELGKLIHDFFCDKAEDMYNKILAERFNYVKKDPKGSDFMCELIEDLVSKRIERIRIENAERLRAAEAEAKLANIEAERANDKAKRADFEVMRANFEAEKANQEAEKANQEAEKANQEAEKANAQAKAEKKSKLDSLKNLLRSSKLTVTELAEAFSMPVEEVESIAKEIYA